MLDLMNEGMRLDPGAAPTNNGGKMCQNKTYQLESFSAFPKTSFWGDKLKWDSASIDLTFSQGHGGSRGQMEGLNKSSVTAGAWLRAQDNTTKSRLTLSVI